MMLQFSSHLILLVHPCDKYGCPTQVSCFILTLLVEFQIILRGSKFKVANCLGKLSVYDNSTLCL